MYIIYINTVHALCLTSASIVVMGRKNRRGRCANDAGDIVYINEQGEAANGHVHRMIQIWDSKRSRDDEPTENHDPRLPRVLSHKAVAKHYDMVRGEMLSANHAHSILNLLKIQVEYIHMSMLDLLNDYAILNSIRDMQSKQWSDAIRGMNIHMMSCIIHAEDAGVTIMQHMFHFMEKSGHNAVKDFSGITNYPNGYDPKNQFYANPVNWWKEDNNDNDDAKATKTAFFRLMHELAKMCTQLAHDFNSMAPIFLRENVKNNIVLTAFNGTIKKLNGEIVRTHI